MENWQESRGHILLLREFLKPRNVDDLPPMFAIGWDLILGEAPNAAIKRFLSCGVLTSADLSEKLSLRFKVTELEDMLKGYGLSPAGHRKQDLILQLIHTHPEDMRQAITDTTVLKCSEKGEKIVQYFLTREGEPPIRDDMSPVDRATTVAKWILAAAGAGVIGNATYDALKRLVEGGRRTPELFTELPKSFRNPVEYDAEYILIRGGEYRYSKTRQVMALRDTYFSKYPVTNRRYDRFIHYLEGEEHELLQVLPRSEFNEKMTEFVSGVEGSTEYLARELPTGLAEKLGSRWPHYEEFPDSLPASPVSWFGALAYCLWVSLVDEAMHHSESGYSGGVYRLPTDAEWEWATREYPWSPDEGSLTLLPRAYVRQHNVSAPVGSHPEDATPEGLMDMVGNIPEMTADHSMRGGSWIRYADGLRCTSHHIDFSGDDRGPCLGFRVVRAPTSVSFRWR
ncbi:MAG: SUMF1/EgtB/PvdO family nonheme iron enzyme [Phycisphaerales bacterium]